MRVQGGTTYLLRGTESTFPNCIPYLPQILFNVYYSTILFILQTNIGVPEEIPEEERFLFLLTQTTEHQERTITAQIYHFYNLLTQKIKRKQEKDKPVTLAEYTQHLRMDDLIRTWKPTIQATKSLREWWFRKGCLQGEKEKFEITLLMEDMCEVSLI